MDEDKKEALNYFWNLLEGLGIKQGLVLFIDLDYPSSRVDERYHLCLFGDQLS